VIATKSTEQVQGEELKAASLVVQAFMALFKAYSLYPEEHIFCRTNLEKFHTQLTAFLESHEEYSLAIEKNAFLYEGEKIFEGPPEESNPAYLLTRDGLVRLAFLQGIDSAEIASMLKIFNQHRSAGDESGGDIVTSFWQAEFKHIEYEEVDIFALESFHFDLGSLKAAPEGTSYELPAMNAPDPGEEQASVGEKPRTIAEQVPTEDEQSHSLVQQETVTNLLLTEQNLKVLEISPEEQSVLQSYVEAEGQTDYTNDIIDILLIILISQKNKKHFWQVLEFLAQVFFDCLEGGRFHFAYKICSNVQTIRSQIKAIRPWTLELMDKFMVSLAAEEQWRELSWVKSPHLLLLYKDNMKFLWHVLRMLTPEVILALGPLMGRLETDDITARNELHTIIESKAKMNPDRLNELLSRSDEKLNLLLFPIVEHLSDTDAARICMQMTHHESVEVRKTGVNGYFTHVRTPDFEALSHLLKDENDAIVGKFLTYLLAQAEKEDAEALLLRFLEQATVEGMEHAHIFEYYKALSECGSSRSVKVLEKILLETKVLEMFSNANAVHKKGAALALRILGTDDAMDILQKGAKSMRPDIRLACQFALKKMK